MSLVRRLWFDGDVEEGAALYIAALQAVYAGRRGRCGLVQHFDDDLVTLVADAHTMGDLSARGSPYP